MRVHPLLGALLAAAVVRAGGAAAGNGVDRFPVTPSLRQVLAGSVEVNRTAADYRLFRVEEGRPGAGKAAREEGWRPLPGARKEFLTPAGVVAFDGYGRGGEVLLVGSPVGKAGPGGRDADGWVVMIVFARPPVWVDGKGEAPGREPAGWPRLASSRRILHLAGTGFEAACYRSPGRAAGVVAQARERLAAAGWKVVQVADGGLAVSRPGGRESFLFARDEDRGCTFLVMAGGNSR